MNTKITALKKKIELKEAQLKSKEELAIRCKEAVKEIKHEIELLNNELAKEEMQEMLDLMGEKNLNIDDVKAAIASGVIVGSAAENKEDNHCRWCVVPEKEGDISRRTTANQSPKTPPITPKATKLIKPKPKKN